MKRTAGLVVALSSAAWGQADAGVSIEDASVRPLALSVLVGADTLPSFGLELSLGRRFTHVTSQAGETGTGSVLFVLPGLEAFVGGARVAGCALCGARVTGGPSVRLGLATVVPTAGVLELRSFWFAGVSVLAGGVFVESAPLSPGEKWFELLVRARLGVEVGPGDGAARLHASAFVDLPALTIESVRFVRAGVVTGLSY